MTESANPLQGNGSEESKSVAAQRVSDTDLIYVAGAAWEIPTRDPQGYPTSLRRVVDHEGDQLPAGTCAHIDPSATL
jgi:hypothetical protein